MSMTPVVLSDAIAVIERAGGATTLALDAHDSPSHSQVSPSTTLLRPPNSTSLRVATSNAPPAAVRADGPPAGVRSLHVTPSHSHRSRIALVQPFVTAA